jgi:hypothetical protein
MRSRFLAWLAFCVCLVAAPKIWAQATTTIRGTVTDPSGAVVAKASVHLIDASSVERLATSDDKGQYVFTGVAPGKYLLRVEAGGFETFEQKDIQVAAGNVPAVNVQLRIPTQHQAVTVRSNDAAEHLNARLRMLPNTGPGVREIRRDAAGRYYVLSAPGPTIDIYAQSGEKIGQIPAKPTQDTEIGYGEDFFLDSSGRVYVADRGTNEIKIYDAKGTLIKKFPVMAPVSVAALPNGEVAVASLVSKRFVDVYDSTGRRTRSIGGISDSTDISTSDATLSHGYFTDDGAGHFYYSLTYLPDPTIRKYDEYGYAAYEIDLPANQFIAKDEGANIKFALRPSGPGERSAESTDQGIGAYGGAGVGHEFGGGFGGMHHEGGEEGGFGGGGYGGGEGEHGYQRRDETGLRASVKIQSKNKRDQTKPEFTAVGVDPATQEVWAAVGNLLFHFDKDGNRLGAYSLYSTEQASLKPNVIVVEPDRLVMAADPFGIFAFPRPDLIHAAPGPIPVSAPAVVPASAPTSAPVAPAQQPQP